MLTVVLNMNVFATATGAGIVPQKMPWTGVIQTQIPVVIIVKLAGKDMTEIHTSLTPMDALNITAFATAMVVGTARVRKHVTFVGRILKPDVTTVRSTAIYSKAIQNLI